MPAGFNCTLVVATDKTVGKARDVDVNMNGNPIDVSVRDGSGWKAFIAGMRQWDASVAQLWVPTNTGLIALRTAWLAGTIITAVFTDDAGYGFSGSVLVSTMKKGEPLEGGCMLDVTLQGTGALTVVTPP